MYVKNQSKDSKGEVEFPDYLFPSPIPVPVAVAVGPQGAPVATVPTLIPGTPVEVDPKEEVWGNEVRRLSYAMGMPWCVMTSKYIHIIQ